MDTELQATKQEVNVVVQEEKFENMESSFENIDYTYCFEDTDSHMKIEIEDEKKLLWNGCSRLQNVDNLHPIIDTGLPPMHQEVKVKEEKFEIDGPCFENVDYTHCFETTDLKLQDNGNVHKNTDTASRNIKQEVKVKDENIENLHPCFEKNDEIYIFDNTASKINHKDSEGNCNFAKVMNTTVKQEIEDTPEELKGKNCNKKHSCFETNDLETLNSNLESSIIEIENNSLNNELSDSPPGNGVTSNKKSDCHLEFEDNIETVKEKTDCHIEFKGNGSTQTDKTDCHIEFKGNGSTQKDKTDCHIEFKGNGSTEKDKADCHIEFEGTGFFIYTDEEMKINSDVFPTVCTVCKANFVSLHCLDKHKGGQRIDNQPVCCTSDKTVKHSEDLVTQSAELSHRCNVCMKGFKTLDDLKWHTTRHTTQRPFQCNICDKKYWDKYTLKKHMLNHSTERPHQCNMCKKGVKTLYSLKEHMVSHRTERPHQCNMCEKNFKSLPELRQHMKRHNTDRPHQCNTWDQSLKIIHDLKTHMNSHSIDRPHQCNMCEKRFKTLISLRTHMSRHNTEKPHECNMCEKGFKSTTALRLHMVSHSTEKPHQCNMCEKAFKRMRELQKHMISHSTERPHQCNMCDKKIQD